MSVVLASDARLAPPMEALLRKGNAVDAVVCGLFAAAALVPSVLLGPAQILVGGIGAGWRAIDGRTRQPGLATKRPRGVRGGQEVPAAATVAVPGLPAAALVAHAAHGKASASAIAAAVAPLARALSAERAGVIARVLGAGAAALAKETEMLVVVGPIAGGLLTAEDLRAVRPANVECELADAGEGWTVARAPWAPRDGGALVQVLVAADARGLVAAACYEVASDGLPINALGLVAAAHAEPVRRGVQRIAPGEPLGAACPLALAHALGVVLALGAPSEDVLAVALATARRRGWSGSDETQAASLPGGALAALSSSRSPSARSGPA